MASPLPIFIIILTLIGPSLAAFHVNTSVIRDTLSLDFYKTKCPNVENVILDVMKRTTQKNPGWIPGVLRLHFHDCFISGCDGSILLKPERYNGFASELASPANGITMRGLEAIDEMKAMLEKQCPGVVSCADILAYAARDAVILAGNRRYSVPAGRRDSGFIDGNMASGLPGGALPISFLTDLYAKNGLTVEDMVTLQGSHSIGRVRCIASTADPKLIKNSTLLDNIPNKKFRLAMMQKYCPEDKENDWGTMFADLNPEKHDSAWGTSYYKNMMRGKGVIPADLAMAIDNSTKGFMDEYAKIDSKVWMHKFNEAMIKIGKLNVMTGDQGEIRRHCSVINTERSTNPAIMALVNKTSFPVM